MKKYIGNAAFGIIFLLAASGSILAETFTANITGAQEVPSNASTAKGFGRVFVNETTGMITYTVTFSGLSSNITAAHIHGPAARGANAGVLIGLSHSGTTSGTFSGSAAITPTQIAQMRAHQTYINIHSANFPGGEIRGQLAPRRVVDFDGDGITDYSVLRFPAGGCPNPLQITYWNQNSRGFDFNQTVPWGQACTDFPAPGDYDGDGKDDFAVYRSNTGQQSFFIIYRSSDQAIQWIPFGIFGDQAVARDYDGDGITDVAVFRRGATASAQTTWFIRQSSDQTVRIINFGLTGNGTTQFDSAIPGDYDGDGKFDLAVYRFGLSPNNTYIVLRSSDGVVTFTQWGNFQTDWIVPGDYDGDGKWEVAAARTGATGSSPMVWWIRQSSDNAVRTQQFGLSSDFPTQGDYDGDGRTDISVWRANFDGANNSAYYAFGSFTGTVIAANWGRSGDFSTNRFDSR